MKKVLKGVVITIVGYLGLSALADVIVLRYYFIKGSINRGYTLGQASYELITVLKEWSQK